MNKFFDKNAVFTVLTREQAKVGDQGYFGDSLEELATNVEHNEVHALFKIYDEDFTIYPFKGDHHEKSFALFLLADKVKNKAIYRPLKNIDELFNFLIPDYFDADTYATYEKAELILRRIYELKSKLTGNIYYKRFFQICLTEEGDIMLDDLDLEYFFENYEIKKDGEFVPFGILKE